MSQDSSSSDTTNSDATSTPAASEGAPSEGTFPTVLRFIIPALILGIGVYFGLRAFRENVAEDEAQPQQAAPPSNVIVTPLQILSAQDTHRVIGSLRAANRAQVAAREEGAVLEVLVDEGDTVARGDILVRLDDRRLNAQIARAQAALTSARAVIEQREAEENRLGTDLSAKRSLFEQEAISESEFLDAQTEAAVSASQGRSAREALTAAGAEIELLEVRREDLVIRAPFDARITARSVELGEWVRPGDALLTLISEGRIEAWLQVPERFAGRIAKGSIQLKVGEGTIEGQNLRVVPEADPVNRGITVIADILDPANRLVPGLSVSAELPVTDLSPRLMVPSDAVVTTYAGPSVFRATPGDGDLPIAERIPVEVLFQREGEVFIASGQLSEDDPIVVEGNERLFPGTSLVTKQRESQESAKEPALASPQSL